MGVTDFFLGWLGATFGIVAVGGLLYFAYRRVRRLTRRMRSRVARRRHHRAHHHAAASEERPASDARAGDLTAEHNDG